MRPFIIAIINQKGGVGKTTTTLNLGAAMAEAGHFCTLLDLDLQRDLSSFAASVGPNQTGNDLALSIVEATPDRLIKILHRIEVETIEGAKASLALSFILMDCPPALGKESAAALQIADLAIVPLQAEFAALRGLQRVGETVAVARGRGNPGLQMKILLTMFDNRVRHCAEVEAETRRVFGTEVLEPVIKRSILFAYAALAGESMLAYAPRSAAAQSYRDAAKEILTLVPVEQA